MGGTLIKDEDARFCKEQLDSEAVIQGFGMTEGSPMWFITGDQAMIDRNDVLYISGRYKDIIIRVGKNLVPSKIEYCLQDLGITAQVIGIVDSIAGEVTVAVLQSYPKEVTKSYITKSIIDNLGPTHAPFSIITLDDLHLKAFLMTATGKIRKVELNEIVNKHFATISETKRTNSSEQVIAHLQEIWAELMNAAPDDISVEDDVTNFADSITRLRLCKILWTRLGQRMYLPDLERNNTIKQQAKLLIDRNYRGDSPALLSDNVNFSESQSNPTASNQSCTELPDSMHGELCAQIIILGPRRLTQVRVALEKCLLTRPVLRTILVEVSGAAGVHAVLCPSQAVYDILISQKSVFHESENQEYLIDDSDQNFEDRMFQAIITDVEGVNTSALILALNHSVFDALFAYGFSLALSDVNFHIRRLRGISRITEALWPPKRAPGWMVGNEKRSKDFITRNNKRRKLNINSQPRLRLTKMQDHPGIERLRMQHFIQAPVIVKTAISILNVIQTGEPHAIFKSFDAGRNWPFLPEWIADRLPPAMSIDGPTLTRNMNMIQIKPKETCGELLTRISEDEKALSSHAHAPWFKILRKLGEDEGPIVTEAAMRQVFNWDLSLRYLDSSVGDCSNLKPLGRMDWPDCGFFWNCGMASAERFCCVVSWDDTQIDVNDINGYVSKLLEMIGWITNSKNWNNLVSSFQEFPMMT
ncbi:uncharacterized protein EAF01_009119 [Botrytis porri]|uniref:uncharacterized protein n=1 Tax=Botrytis porri TaxID=87229 RepID=UPI0018FF53C8|nr:uncharacterized protein EAF01_009119 [Botrytis porri]KAF7896716.1 hypothetical protein EAF01_009119 [Botrytis porri]